ncbi:MAG: hypothetical protein ACP5N2_02150 [Candidatus Nanoarchaeia archaeon]
MIIIILIVALIGLMFWYPQSSSNYKYSAPIKPTKKQRYVANINRLMHEGHYEIVADLLARTKYSKTELPFEHWKQKINSQLVRVLKESEQIDSLRNLEKLLDS